MPGHLTSFKVGGHFGAKGSSLNHLGAGAPLRRFNYASESPRSGTRRHHRQTESCKPNKTKQNMLASSHTNSLADPLADRLVSCLGDCLADHCADCLTSCPAGSPFPIPPHRLACRLPRQLSC